MKKLLFIDHQFHTKTLSSQFLLSILEDEFDVDICMVDRSIQHDSVDLKKLKGNRYDILICWQIMPDITELKKYFSFNKGVLFPMADDVPRIHRLEKWFSFRDFKIISFSKQLADKLASTGFHVHYLQYFPKPLATKATGSLTKAFFWSRSKDLTIKKVLNVFNDSGLDSMHIHLACDPQHHDEIPTETSNLSISSSHWFEKKDDLMHTIKEAAVYIAPRKKEGIGMSFLEAMAMGRCVVAYNDTTMNEYIIHGSTGILFEENASVSLSEQQIQDIQNQTLEYMHTGYKKWSKDKLQICKWIQEPSNPNKIRLFKKLTIRLITSPHKLPCFLSS